MKLAYTVFLLSDWSSVRQETLSKGSDGRAESESDTPGYTDKREFPRSKERAVVRVKGLFETEKQEDVIIVVCSLLLQVHS